MQSLIVAGLSARLMAEAAARDGYRPIALDLFGDADTRRAAERWLPVGGARGLRLDAQRTLQALEQLAREPDLLGWVAGSDFECEPELLERAAAALPLLGTAPADVRRVRDLHDFCATLDALGLPHPETRRAPPSDAGGWLRKNARGAGGWHIRRADDPAPTDAAREPYYQREVSGTPMSALFVADGQRARRIGFNELLVRPLGAHPHVLRGALGPVALPAPLAQRLDAMLDTLAATYALRGLASLDFVRDGDTLWLLEINPRPSASMALYAELPLMRAHVEACTEARLPAPPTAGRLLRGCEIVFARAALTLDARQAAQLAARGDCHDLPLAGARFAPGDPLCSVSAASRDAAELRALLAGKRQTLRDALAQTRDTGDDR